jgi:hypothetical protein
MDAVASGSPAGAEVADDSFRCSVCVADPDDVEGGEVGGVDVRGDKGRERVERGQGWERISVIWRGEEGGGRGSR